MRELIDARTFAVTLCFLFISFLAYGALGSNIAPFVLDSIQKGGLKLAIGVFLAFHVLVTYTFM